MVDFDAVVIGGGHNGLVAAGLLAKAGRSVMVLEARGVLGGAAATQATWPGYHVETGAPDAALFSETVGRALFLKMHGLSFVEPPVDVFAPQPDGRALAVSRDAAATVASIAAFDRGDAARYPAFARRVERLAGLLAATRLLTPPDIEKCEVGDLLAWGGLGVSLKRLGREDMMALLRILPLPVKDFLDEELAGDALKGVLGATAMTGLHQGPRAAGTTLMLLYQSAGGLLRTRFVAGGMGQLSAALASAARAYGATLRCDAPVARILLEEGRGAEATKAIGVALADGTEITSRIVLSSADPRRTLFGLVGPQHLDPHLMRQVRNILFRGTTARVNLALNGLPAFKGQREATDVSGRIRIAPSLDYLERAFDAAKYGGWSETPYLEATIPTLHTPRLAPAGKHVLSVTLRYAPYRLAEGDWDDARARLGETAVGLLADYVPGLRALVDAIQVITPLDYERDYSLTEGSIHHGQMALDQMLMMRPVPGWSQYRTPIDNLYLCGAGTHPGGGVTGAPGYNAAREALKAL